MTVSVIVTTYNWPEALILTLQSLLRQSHLPDEVIVADDGSGEETAKTVAFFTATAPFPLRHSWQEDLGFRLAMSRNRAIAQAQGEYIIIIDGDLILHPRFVEDHLNHATPKHYLQGGRVLLSSQLSQRIFDGSLDPNDLSIFTPELKNRKNALRSPLLTTVFSTVSTSLKAIKGCNFSLFKKDILDVNGFDNCFVGWGREDSEFVARLFHHGVKRKNLKFSAIAFHLYHKENTRDTLSENDRRLEHTIREKLIRCEDGIDSFIKELK